VMLQLNATEEVQAKEEKNTREKKKLGVRVKTLIHPILMVFYVS